MIDLAAVTYGPLSPKMQERLPNLLQTDLAPLNETDNDLHMPHDFRVLRLGQNFGQFRGALRRRAAIRVGRG
jgi:hypothetical protein